MKPRISVHCDSHFGTVSEHHIGRTGWGHVYCFWIVRISNNMELKQLLIHEATDRRSRYIYLLIELPGRRIASVLHIQCSIRVDSWLIYVCLCCALLYSLPLLQALAL
ncbi:hypothetical protein H112_03220 [Trichophyton rubrum D6]|uniref:Uncharacterized protein n=2 Tax=Trichophyton rubrum TaxID=5551 RepID=F2STN3_TRIRC|nr:uncharacterized protein TERG_05831 [Trichophyton rubrum CBS 118892]EZF24367.1 hypothetical protein H100_03224 [Trichophyton rubrum MR850]EZF43328.1 hypothetical protein H102_03218 [Trichophyton rubrum CBS 100081]EZF53970.1 hypothetical protein H103_03232 [Trichophyton rubrum CBS 288.86]EZF64553.1 hypothetical protein H104_03214 [Trichophyton rubrum CBS 289.86]EZF85897.1 hypothetical protein H110_03225 [Trichophyton rubrum MR1448]EZF96678.1 hypothetical protein H113_03233 [Trichophyton rubr